MNYFNLPLAGSRSSYTIASPSGWGSYGFYWTSSPNSQTSDNARAFTL
jgi:hypothetical protein